MADNNVSNLAAKQAQKQAQEAQKRAARNPVALTGGRWVVRRGIRVWVPK